MEPVLCSLWHEIQLGLYKAIHIVSNPDNHGFLPQQTPRQLDQPPRQIYKTSSVLSPGSDIATLDQMGRFHTQSVHTSQSPTAILHVPCGVI